ncbi:hypothetical protein ACSBR2_028663 [Camellia fascicularis]
MVIGDGLGLKIGLSIILLRTPMLISCLVLSIVILCCGVLLLMGNSLLGLLGMLSECLMLVFLGGRGFGLATMSINKPSFCGFAAGKD